MLSGPEVSVADVGVAEIVATEGTVGVVVARVARRRARPPLPLQARGPNTPICRQESGMGAECTENSAGEYTSVRNRRPAPGRISILKDLPNEILTSLAAHSILLFMTLFII